MKNLKFKFWCKSEKRFVTDPKIGGSGRVLCMDGISGSNNVTDDIVVCQYTGVNDLAGREIYEGDIVRSELGTEFEVSFDDGSYVLLHKDGYHTLALSISLHWKLVIVGNIFENKK